MMASVVNLSSPGNVAVEVAVLVASIKTNQEALDDAKAQLIRLVGDSGETFETHLGKVQVTQRTSDRKTGQYSFSLNSEVFNGLDERVQANLVKQGVVSKTEKVIKGQAPVVKVVLA